jgi:hypothetical protein
MKGLTIEAKSLQSAREIEAAPRGFDRELLAGDGRYSVRITLRGGSHGVVAVFNALQQYIQQRGAGEPAQISLDGQSYLMESFPWTVEGDVQGGTSDPSASARPVPGFR